MNNELLKQAGEGNYCDELLAHIRDIRSYEKVFWRKVFFVFTSPFLPFTEFSRSLV